MAAPFSRDGRDYYTTPDGKLVSVESGFDVASTYQGLVPATADDVAARDYEKRRAPIDVLPEYNRDEAGNLNPDAALGSSNVAQDSEGLAKIKEFIALEPAPPEAPKPFTREGRDYYVTAGGQIASVEAGFDPSEDYPELSPATEEQVHKHAIQKRKNEIQKRSGSFADQLATFPKAAIGSVATLVEGVTKEANELDPRRFLTQYRKTPLTAAQKQNVVELLGGFADEQSAAEIDKADKRRTSDGLWNPDAYLKKEKLAPVAFTPKALEQQEANPVSAFLGAAAPDVAANFLIPGAGVETFAARQAVRATGSLTARALAAGGRAVSGAVDDLVAGGVKAAAARQLASSLLTESGNAVIEGDEFDMGRSLGVWAPTQVALELAGNTAFRGAASALGWSRNAVNAAVERARSSAVQDALRETDPVKQAAKLMKEAPHVYEHAQSGLDEALSTIDERIGNAPEKLFRPSALKRSVSSNINAQADAVVDIATQLSHAAEVSGAEPLAKAAKLLDNVRGSGGPVLYRAARDAWSLLTEAGLENPLAREALEKLERTLGDETVWGRAARDHTGAVAEAARAGEPLIKHSVRDLAAREALEARLEQARRVASLTKDEKLGRAVEKAREALGTADKVTGARLLGGKATPAEVETMRKSLDAFPDKAPKVVASVAKHLDTLDEVGALLPDTWTVERVERHIAERAAGSKAARKELDDALDAAEKKVRAAKSAKSLTPGKIARAESTLTKLRDALDEVDEIAKSSKIVRDFDAAPLNRAERFIDAATGKVASAVASRITSTVGGAAAGYAGGGVMGATVGALGGEMVNKVIEPVIREKAGKFGQWLKTSLRKHGRTGLGAAAIVGANQLAYDEDDPSPQAAAAIGMLAAPMLLGGKGKGLRRLSGHMTEWDIREALEPILAEGEEKHLYSLLKDAKVPSHRGGGVRKLYDASHVGVTPEGRLVVFNKQGFAQHTSRYRYQESLPGKEPSAKPADESALEAHRQRVENVQREAGFSERTHRGHDTIPVNEKALTALARKTGAAIKQLEPEEQLALLDYIEGGGAATFRALQRGEAVAAGKEQLRAALPAFESAVEKLQRPGLTETVGPLWRGFHISPEDAARLVNSKFVETGALTSTSFKPFTAKDLFADTQVARDLGHVPIVLKFEHVERAAPISAAGFSKQYGSSEREALLPPGSTFEITDVNKRTWKYGGDIEVTLREVPKRPGLDVGFVLTGLLGLGAAAQAASGDDDDSGALAAGVGGLGLLALLSPRTMSRALARRSAADAAIAAMEKLADRQIVRLDSLVQQARPEMLEALTHAVRTGSVSTPEELIQKQMAHFDAVLEGQPPLTAAERTYLEAEMHHQNVNAIESNGFLRAAHNDLPVDPDAPMPTAAERTAAGMQRVTDSLVDEISRQLPQSDGNERRETLDWFIGRWRHEFERVNQRAPTFDDLHAVRNRLDASLPERPRATPASARYEDARARLQARTEARDRVTRETMRELRPAELESMTRAFRDAEDKFSDVWPVSARADAIVDHIRETRGFSGPAEEVWLRDQLGQDGGDWDDLIREAAEWDGAHFEEHINEWPGITADDIIRRIESGELNVGNKELTPWQEYNIRHQYAQHASRYNSAAENAARETFEASAQSSEPPRAQWTSGSRLEADRSSPGADGLPEDSDALHDAGINVIRVFDDDGIDNVFGRALTLEDMRELFGLQELTRYARDNQLGLKLDSALTVSDDSVRFRGEVGEMHIERIYKKRRDGNGYDIHNSYFILPDELQAEGVGKKILTRMADANERLGGKEMSLGAAWIGKYIWAKLGFRPSVSAETAARDAFAYELMQWTGSDKGLSGAIVAGVRTIRDLADAKVPLEAVRAKLPGLKGEWQDTLSRSRAHMKPLAFDKAFIRKGKNGAPDEFLAGKAFLLMRGGPWNEDMHLKIEPAGDWYQEYRRRIGAGAAVLGFGLHELLQAMNEGPMTVFTETSPRQADEDEAERILTDARDKADAINEAREQQLDETRDKLAYLSHQGRTLMQSAARTLASPANDNDVRKVERIPGVTGSAGVARFIGSHSNLNEAFEDKRRTLAALQRDPLALVEDLADSFGELQDNAPELHAQVVAQTFKVANYLQAKVPVPVGSSLVRPEGVPVNSFAVRQFALYYSAATDPASVITDLANNRARKEQVDTLRDLWPETYQDLKLAVLERMSQQRPTVAQRVRLDLLFDFGQQFDRALSPGLVAALDTYRAQQGQKGGAEPGQGKEAPSRRSQPSIGGTSATGALGYGPAAGPGTLA